MEANNHCFFNASVRKIESSGDFGTSGIDAKSTTPSTCLTLTFFFLWNLARASICFSCIDFGRNQKDVLGRNVEKETKHKIIQRMYEEEKKKAKRTESELRVLIVNKCNN